MLVILFGRLDDTDPLYQFEDAARSTRGNIIRYARSFGDVIFKDLINSHGLPLGTWNRSVNNEDNNAVKKLLGIVPGSARRARLPPILFKDGDTTQFATCFRSEVLYRVCFRCSTTDLMSSNNSGYLRQLGQSYLVAHRQRVMSNSPLVERRVLFSCPGSSPRRHLGLSHMYALWYVISSICLHHVSKTNF